MGPEPQRRRVDRDVIDTVQLLFPGAQLSLDRASSGDSAFRLVPGWRRTHMLVPAASPTAAAAAVDRPTAKDRRRHVLRRRAAAGVLRRPLLARIVMPDVLHVGTSSGSILEYLEDVVGHELVFSMALGARRANRKPVLSVHGLDGRRIGYAKVGLTSLSNALISHEADTLRSLGAGAPLQEFRAPNVLHHGSWDGHDVLLMESLRPSANRPSRGLPHQAVAELAARDGIGKARPEGSAWFRAVMSDADSLRAQGQPQLWHAAARYAHTFREEDLPLGVWHGDLGPWNMAWDVDLPLIWDWERCQGQVPFGIDAVHFTCHEVLRGQDAAGARDALGGPGTEALRSVLSRAPVEPLSTRTVRALLLGYLLLIGARFSVDSLRPDGGVVADLARWYLSVLEDEMDAEEHTPWN